MKLKLLSSILTLCFFGILSAQNYPVTVVPQAVSPSPIYLSSYADAGTVNSPLRVQLLLNDITLSNIEVRLKTYFEGNGIRFESNNAVVGANPIYLEGGVPVNLTNIQLAPFYSLQNISGVNSNQYAQPIPEGSYQFCFEVYDAFTGNRLSARSCATTYIFKNEPPFLVLPHKNETIDVRNPQNIVFQWTPRHINVSNVEYELSIVEIWDNYVDPQAAFFSMPPIFQATTRNTSYLLGPADPILLPNKKYAWRVQAKAISGTEEIGLFNNNGYSEIFWFSHSQPCEIPANIKSEVKGTHQANIEWDDFSTEIPEYKVRYREKNSSSQGDWFYSRSNTNWVTIWDLRPGTTYEYQVNRKCQLIESEYSPVKTFTTFLADDESGLYNCGISPEIDITNADPLPDLFVNDVFKAGDFPIKVLEVSGSSGRFTGKGYVSMPYLKNIKVAVEFTNILINTDKNLIEGMVITKYDPTWSNILDTDGVIDSVEDIVDVFTGGDNTILDPVDYDIKTVTIKDGQIVVTGTNGEQTTYDYDEGDTYQISGTNGVFAIDKNGKVSQIGETAEGGPATAENTEGINTSGNGTVESPSVAQVYTEGATVIFRKGSETKYELDMVDNSFEQSTYPKAQRSDGKDYYPVHKAVVNGNKDIFYADITITNNAINIDSLVFKTVETGLKLTTEKVDNDTYKIEVEGRNAYRNEEAIITYKDATGQQRVIASFFIHHLHKLQTRKVQIVSVNGASAIEGLGATLNTVFGVAGASFDVKSDIHKINIDPSVWDIDEKNDVLDYNGSGLLPDYPKEIRAIHQYYMANTANYDSKAYYVFLVDNSIKVSKAINGFMPKGRQFGYIFNAYQNQGLGAKDEQDKVVAHELGHGVFSLEHPFESDSNAGNTQWLMDYNANGTQLPFTHWAVMSETGLNLQLFQPDEEGEFAKSYIITPDFKWSYINDTSTLFSGFNKEDIATGTLPGFVLRVKGKDIFYNWKDGKYRNYEYPDSIYTHTTKNILADDQNVMIFYNIEKGCGSKSYISLKYKDVKQFELSDKGLLSIVAKYASKSKLIPCAVKDAVKSPASWDDYSAPLDCKVESIENTLKENLEAINTITSNTSAEEALNIIQANYSPCLFELIDIDQRITILDLFLTDDIDDSQWEFSTGDFSTNDQFFIGKFITSTPPQDRLKILKEGLMKDNYRWIRVLYDKSTGVVINNDVFFNDVAPIFMKIGEWVTENFEEIKKETIFTVIPNFKFDDIEGFTQFNYSPGLQPFMLGVRNFDVELNSGDQTTTRISSSKTDVTDNGRIWLYNRYALTDNKVYLHPGGTPSPSRTGFFEYNQAYTPFEPVTIMAGNSKVGIPIGQEIVVPAIVALTYQQLLIDEKSESDLRKFGNAVMIIGGVISAPFSGGTSLAAVSALIATGGIAVGGIDLFMQKEDVDKSSELYQAWDAFYMAYGIIDFGVGGTTAGISAFNKLKTINLVKSYNRFNTALKGAKVEIKTALSKDFNEFKTIVGGEGIISVGNLVKYSKLRSFLGDGKIKAYLNNQQLIDLENVLKTVNDDVLKVMDDFKSVDEFAEMVRGYKDSPIGFTNAVKNLESFNGTHGWLSFWKLTPRMENSLKTIAQLKKDNKIVNVGNATDIQLSSIHAYTANGDFINQPFRYQPTWFGEYNTRAIKHINAGLDELRKIPQRVVRNEEVFSGKTFSKADFENKFIGKINTIHPYNGYMSTSKLESVAEGFIDLTKQWATGSGEKIAVIQRVISKNGVYIDDISDWGKNLGKTNHPDPKFLKVQIQEEVLLNSQKLKQVSEPIPVIENGVHKTIEGIKVYYVDFIEVL